MDANSERPRESQLAVPHHRTGPGTGRSALQSNQEYSGELTQAIH